MITKFSVEEFDYRIRVRLFQSVDALTSRYWGNGKPDSQPRILKEIEDWVTKLSITDPNKGGPIQNYLHTYIPKEAAIIEIIWAAIHDDQYRRKSIPLSYALNQLCDILYFNALHRASFYKNLFSNFLIFWFCMY